MSNGFNALIYDRHIVGGLFTVHFNSNAIYGDLNIVLFCGCFENRPLLVF